MSISSSLFRHKQADHLHDMDDLRQQNRFLMDENSNLKRSLQQLITINTELTQSIEDFNASHVQNFPHINQQEIEQLALQVIQLQQELERQKQQKKQMEEKIIQGDQALKVIEQLVNSIREMQDQYQQQLIRIQGQLGQQRDLWDQMAEMLQQKLMMFESQYDKAMNELRFFEKGVKNNVKQLKISTTIEDLRFTFQKQIKEKDGIIGFYQNIVEDALFTLKKLERD